MIRAIWMTLAASLSSCAPAPAFAESLVASYYGVESGTRTASGATFHPNGLTAAHRSLPFGTRLRVCRAGRCVDVVVSDRGPFVRGRGLDLSRGAAAAIGMLGVGVAPGFGGAVVMAHWSDCAVHNEPAYPAGECNCGCDAPEVYNTLSAANAARQKEWDSGNQLTLAYRGNEMAGEVGEACNVIKKLERERLGIKGSRDTVAHLMEELGDVVICAYLCAMDVGGDLDQAVRDKFNATSEKMGLKTRLVG